MFASTSFPLCLPLAETETDFQAFWETAQPFAAFLVGIAVVGFWIALILQTTRSKKLFPYRYRTPVPWNGFDVVVLFLIYLFVIPLFCLKGVEMAAERLPAFEAALHAPVIESEAEEAPSTDEKEELSQADELMPDTGAGSDSLKKDDLERSHALAILILKDGRLWVLVLCFLSATVLAPLGEEFIFRLLLQGYLEKLEWRFRAARRNRDGGLPPSVPQEMDQDASGQKLPYGFFSVLVPAVTFAAFHYRSANGHPPMAEMLEMMIAQSMILFLVLLIGLGYLKSFYRIRWDDLGIDWDQVPSDIVAGIFLYAICFLPLMATQWVLNYFFEDFVPDPITLAFFAWGLGFLYFRKHSIVAPVAMHMGLNLTSTVMLLLIRFLS